MRHANGRFVVQYAADASEHSRALSAKQRGVLSRALWILSADPYHALSAPVSDDGNDRVVQASQTLHLTYRVSPGSLTVLAVQRHERDRDTQYLPRVDAAQENATPTS